MAQGPLLGLWLFFIMHTVGALALFIASFPVHRTEYAWSDGCQPVEEDKEDFGECVEGLFLFPRIYYSLFKLCEKDIPSRSHACSFDILIILSLHLYNLPVILFSILLAIS